MIETTLDVISLSTVEAAIDATASHLLVQLEKSVATKKPVLLLLAGGSAVKVYTKLARLITAGNYHPAVFANLALAMEDERWPEKNNTAETQASGFIAACQKLGATFIEVPQAQDMHQAVTEYQRLLTRFLADPEAFVIAMVGVGGDGHILSVNVDADAQKFATLFQSPSFFTAYVSQATTAQFPQFPRRLTLTLTGLVRVDYIVGLVAGAEKKPILQQLKNETPAKVHQLPALALRSKSGQLFTDQQILF